MTGPLGKEETHAQDQEKAHLHTHTQYTELQTYAVRAGLGSQAAGMVAHVVAGLGTGSEASVARLSAPLGEAAVMREDNDASTRTKGGLRGEEDGRRQRR